MLQFDNFINMDSTKSEVRGNIYNQHFKNFHKKKSIQTSETTIDVLPSIKLTTSAEKVNSIRNQVTNTKEQIVEMEAKLKKLRKIKEKYQAQKQQNLTRIQFMSDVKQRLKNDQLHKQKIRQVKNQSLQELKSQVSNLRESLIKEKKVAEDNLLETKINAAQEERRRQKHHDYLIKKLKELDHLEANRKVEKVKEFHEQSASRMKEFHTSRVKFSKENYQKKVLSALKERQSVSQTLRRMKLEQESLKNLVKQSQKQMLTSLYSLQTINPQKRRRRTSFFNKSQRSDKSLKIDLDNYQNQQFQG